MSRPLDMPTSAEIVIVGAGVIGLSIAFQLAERGQTDVLVIDRDAIASGATSNATGGIRQQFTTEANIKLSTESVRFFEQFQERVGAPLLFRQIGYLFLISDPRQMEAFTRSAELQRSLGVPTELLTPAEVKARHPVIDVEGLVGATFCGTDGAASPADAAYAFGRRARDLGVQIHEGVEVVGFDMSGDRITGVRTTGHGTIAPGLVINATGPWSALLGQMAGVPVPVHAHPRQVFTLTPVEELDDNFPFAIDMLSGVYVHKEPGATLLGGGDRDREESYEPILDWERFNDVVMAAINRVPVLEDAQSVSGWCGLREMTDDDHCILGPAKALRNFWNATGFSGHGFMHAPAVGRIMTEWLLDGQPKDTDVTPFLLERFDDAGITHERLVF